MTWLDEAHELCDELLGGSVPVYIRHANGHQHLQLLAGAYTSSDADLRLHPGLVADGAWKGRGCGIVIAHEWPADAPASEFVNVTTTVHEICHWVTYPPQPAIEDLPPGTLDRIVASDMQASWDACLWAAIKQQARRGEPLRGHAPWHAHEADFWRMVVHAAARVRQMGLPVWPIHLADPQHYGLSAIDNYVEVLRDELDEKRDCGLIEIARTPPPAALVELFQRDTLRHTCVPLVVAR